MDRLVTKDNLRDMLDRSAGSQVPGLQYIVETKLIRIIIRRMVVNDGNRSKGSSNNSNQVLWCLSTKLSKALSPVQPLIIPIITNSITTHNG
jgi:hypothetical protein